MRRSSQSETYGHQSDFKRSNRHFGLWLVRAGASQKARFHRLILEIEDEASGFDFSAASTPFQDFSSSPPRAALPRSSSARRIFKDTRAVPLPSVPRVVARLVGSRQAAQPPRKPPFCRLGPSILISNGKPNVSSDTQGAPCNPIHRPPRRDESKSGLGQVKTCISSSMVLTSRQ